MSFGGERKSNGPTATIFTCVGMPLNVPSTIFNFLLRVERWSKWMKEANFVEYKLLHSQRNWRGAGKDGEDSIQTGEREGSLANACMSTTVGPT